MKPGENCYESAARILKRELGLVLPASAQRHVQQQPGGGRFQGVGAYSYTWDMREQAPKTNGCADISVVMAIEVSALEIAAFKMDNQEYEQHAWVDAMQVVHDTGKHAALRRSVADYVKTLEWNALEKEAGEDDAAVGRALKAFLRRWAEVDRVLLAAQDEDNSKKRAKPTT